MKSQLSFVIKPIILIATIILIIVLVFALYGSEVKEKEREKSLDLVAIATNTLLILANSEDCLAFHLEETHGAYANIVSIDKIIEFSKNYKDIEPECARSFDFGWRASIEELDLNGNVVKNWSFGAREFSQDRKEEINFWMPVAIRYSSKDVRPGRMRIQIVYGELENIAGIFDRVCKMKKDTKVKVSIENDININGNEICIKNKCRKLYCNVEGRNEIKRGEYILNIGYLAPNKLIISI